MKSPGQPKRPGSQIGDGEENSDDDCVDEAPDASAGVHQMYRSKKNREHHDGPCGTSGFDQSLKRITAEHEFLSKGARQDHQYNQSSPFEAVRRNRGPKTQAAENHDRDDGDEYQASADRAAQAELPR